MPSEAASKVQAIADAWKRSTEAAKAAGQAAKANTDQQPPTEQKG